MRSFMREKKIYCGKHYREVDISEFMGPSTAQMAGNSIVLADVEEKAQEVINKRVEHEITRILNGYGG